MPALSDLLTRRDRTRLLERLQELDSIGRLMREAGGLAEAPEPLPLHRSRRDNDTTERTEP